jgi:predicted dehydrogenase
MYDARPVEDKVRLGSVGLGNWAGVLARATGRSDLCEIVNCWSRSEESGRRFQETYAIPRRADTLDALLADHEVEGILVTTPNDAHKPVILEALAAGKAVYTDKPIAHNLADGLAILRAVEASGRVFAVGHSARRLAGHRVMRTWLDEGRLGGVSMVEAHFTTRRGLALTPESWRYYAEKSPGGALIQLGVHHADTLQHLFGPVASVSARLRRLYANAEVPDTAMALLEFDSGPIGVLVTGWAAPAVYQMRIYGTEANLFFDLDLGYWDRSDVVDAHSTLSLQSRGQSGLNQIELKPADMFREQIEEFALAIKGRKAVEVTGEDSIRALAVIMAAVTSSERGGAVVLPAELLAEAEASLR